MKRWIKYVVVLVVAGFFLVGCKGDDNPHEPVNSKNKGEEVKVFGKTYKVNKNGVAIYNRYEEAVKLVQKGKYEEGYQILEDMGSEFEVNTNEGDVIDLINDVRTQTHPIDDLVSIDKIYKDFDSDDPGYLPNAYHELTDPYYENIYSFEPLDSRIEKIAKYLQAKYAKKINKQVKKYDKEVTESISREQAQATTESSAKIEVSVDSEGFYHMDDESYNNLRDKISEKNKRANGITDNSSQNEESVISSKEEAVAQVREKYGDSNGDTLFQVVDGVKEDSNGEYYVVKLVSKKDHKEIAIVNVYMNSGEVISSN